MYAHDDLASIRERFAHTSIRTSQGPEDNNFYHVAILCVRGVSSTSLTSTGDLSWTLGKVWMISNLLRHLFDLSEYSVVVRVKYRCSDFLNCLEDREAG